MDNLQGFSSVFIAVLISWLIFELGGTELDLVSPRGEVFFWDSIGSFAVESV